ncbi:MAG: helix-turn-helix transcriptional regulator [Solobacterium sp.]|nr:helix-turn-helix transcriptional regulator [Solobacterium sp.]
MTELTDKEKMTRIRTALPPDEELYDLAEVFKVFGDQTRVKIMYSILKGELCVAEIADVLDMTQSAISHQLRILKNAKLVKSRRDGKVIYYSLDDDHVAQILQIGTEHLEEQNEKGEE